MKKYILVLISILVLVLSACEPEPEPEPIELDYLDFPNHLITSYNDAEKINENKYVVYYYSETCGHCHTIKQDVLEFFEDFETLPFYILNIFRTTDYSTLEEFIGTPTVFVMSDDQVSETYIGVDEVYEFISGYSDIELDYSSFDDVHLTTYQEVLDIEKDVYILYYYLNDCPYCIMVKNSVLEWAFTKSVGDIYFMNGAYVTDPDNIPTELTILNSGTPIIVLMSNGEFTDEYYSGSEEVLEYILEIGSDKIAKLND